MTFVALLYRSETSVKNNKHGSIIQVAEVEFQRSGKGSPLDKTKLRIRIGGDRYIFIQEIEKNR
jgi:hypothetical protein